MKTDDSARRHPRASSPLRILIVDDEPTMCDFLRIVVEQEGHETRTVHNVPNALWEWRSWKPSLVLLDLAMPRHPGIEFVRRVREAADELPIVIITGYLQPDWAAALGKLGVTAILEKPFAVDALIKAVRGVAGVPTRDTTAR